ncbi:helix-turn-helix transcriptional regulator [bacterium]|nr:helix-turn-helix transcriptional regulator [bacterium]
MELYEVRRKNLIRLLKEKGLSKSEFAAKIGCKPSFMSALCASPEKSNHRNIGNKVIQKLAKGLEVPIDEFHMGLTPSIIADEFTRLIIDYLPRLHDEDKKTVLRNIVRYLNPPEIASKVISDLFKAAPEKK